MSGKSIALKFARPVYRLVRPIFPAIMRYYSAYQNYKVAGMYHAGATTIKDYCFVEKKLAYCPLVSVVVPVYNPNEAHFLEMVYSVVNQHYENWELILVNASSDKNLRRAAENCAGIDTRIKVVAIENNQGISANTNIGLKQASGEYVAFLDHDDLLHPCALHSIVEALQEKIPAGLLYTDEDKISDNGDRFYLPHYKPDWSPSLLRNVNYITHLTVLKKDLVDKLGGLRSTCDGAQDYDLMLRAADEKVGIRHVPRVLYHWRAAEGSTADAIANKSYVFKAGVRALSDHLKRNNINAKAVSLSGKPGYYEVIYPKTSYSIIIGPVSPSKYAAAARWLRELMKLLPEAGTAEIVIGDWYKKFEVNESNESMRLKFIDDDGGDYWRRAAAAANKEAAVCMKIAALPVDAEALEKLAAAAAHIKQAVLSPVITDHSGTIFGSGIVNVNDVVLRLFEGYKYGRNSFFGDTDWVRDVDDLTTEVVALRTSTLRSLLKKDSTDYDNAATVGALISSQADKSSSIIWGYSLFEYLGPLKFTNSNRYHRVQQFRFVHTPKLVIDNWGEKNEIDEES
ncbi:MAG TPA: glycosyltransferase [Candidatus Saccharimonadales bacterium]|nr:glycosyltransferase [Candidatus Saccharimonadales bacterium]